mgnify:CR=1 FL=1
MDEDQQQIVEWLRSPGGRAWEDERIRRIWHVSCIASIKEDPVVRINWDTAYRWAPEYGFNMIL